MSRKYLVAIFVILICGCKNNPTANNSSNIFFPLAKGNYWKYTIPPSFSGQVDTILQWVDQDSIMNDQKWFVVLTKQGYLTTHDLEMNGQEGLLSFSYITKTPLIIYKYPVKINDTYISMNPTDTIRVVGVQNVVKTPLGSFNCVVYQRRFQVNDSLQNKIWWYGNDYVSPGIGRVKQDLFYYDSLMIKKKLGEMLLLEYSLK